jgi:hypothetical protein
MVIQLYIHNPPYQIIPQHQIILCQESLKGDIEALCLRHSTVTLFLMAMLYKDGYCAWKE